MDDCLKRELIYELTGKLLADAERELQDARRYRREMIGADLARTRNRADMVAICVRSAASSGMRIGALIASLLADGTAPENTEPTEAGKADDLGLCVVAAAGEGSAK